MIMRVKLPGSPKIKAIILAILVIISVCVIGKTAIDNRKASDLKSDGQKEEQESIQKVEESNAEEDMKKKEEEEAKKAREDELYKNAYDLFHNKKYAEAINSSNTLISEFNDSYRGYSIKGIAEGYSGNFDAGMNDIDKALELNPNYGYGRFNKALLYELNGKFDEALEWYDKALEIEKYMWSYYGKASIYGRKGATKEAVFNLKLAIDSATNDADKNSLKESARNEEDFDPINGDKEFQNVIK